MQDMASALRSVSRLADVFGDMSEGAKDLVGSLAEVIDNFGRLKALHASESFAAMGAAGQAAATAVPVIGVAAGIVGALKGYASLINDRREQAREEVRAMAELREALLDGAKRFARAVDEMLKAARPGRDVSAADAAEAQALLKDGPGRPRSCGQSD